jgi:hypothetical protein
VTKTRKVGVSSEVSAVLTATFNVIGKFQWFEGKCDIAIDKVRKMAAPNKRICNMTKSILDGSGAILKTACLVTQLKNFNDAQAFCQSNNMRSLFAITKSFEDTGILSFASSIFAKFTGQSYLSINGLNLVTGNTWLNRNPLYSPLFKGVQPNMCASMFGASSTFAMRGISCFRKCSLICEFALNQTPVQNSCNFLKNITNTSGTPVKRACISDTVTNTGNNYCKDNNMRGLFKIRDQNELSSMVDLAIFCANKVFGSINGNVFCIDGYQLPNKTWYSYDSSLIFTATPPTVFEQNFMKIASTASGPKFHQYPENTPLWFLCEFK